MAIRGIDPLRLTDFNTQENTIYTSSKRVTVLGDIASRLLQ